MSPKILEGLDPIHTTAFVLCMHTRTCLHFYAFILSILLFVYLIIPVFFSNDNYIPVLALWPAAAFSFMLNGSEFSRRLKRKNLQYRIHNPKLMFAVPTNIVTAILLLVSILVSFPQRRGLLGRYLAEDLTFLLHGDIFARNSSTTQLVQEFPSLPEQRAITGLVCCSILCVLHVLFAFLAWMDEKSTRARRERGGHAFGDDVPDITLNPGPKPFPEDGSTPVKMH